jgi:hypothetical protein
MAWLDDVWSLVANVAPAAINAGTRLYGQQVATDANTEAARIAAQGNTDAARIAAEAALRGAGLSNQQIEAARAERAAASGRGIEAIRAGTGDYAATTAPLLQERPVLTPSYRGLTAAQQIARDDLRRGGMAALAASGMRGSGAGIRSIMDQDRRFLADAAAATDSRNLSARQAARSTADAARQNLGQVYQNQGTQIANTELQVGSQNASGLERIGSNLSAATTSGANAIAGAGQTNANLTAQAGLSNAGLASDTLGALGSLIADSTKNYGLRSGSYETERRV